MNRPYRARIIDPTGDPTNFGDIGRAIVEAIDDLADRVIWAMFAVRKRD